MTTLKDICSEIASEEGKRHQASIGDIREIVRIIAEMMYMNEEVGRVLVQHGKRRWALKNKLPKKAKVKQ